MINIYIYIYIYNIYICNNKQFFDQVTFIMTENRNLQQVTNNFNNMQ